MKIILIFVFFFLFASGFFQSKAHVQQETNGVYQGFCNLQQGKGIVQSQNPSAIFEKRADSVDSTVFDIHGMEQFERIVLKNSYSRPVVLKIYMPTYKDINQLTNIFQDVALHFNSNIIVFAGLDVVKNAQLYMQIYAMCNLKNIELPLFLFYEKGQLRMPFLMGMQHKDAFVEIINKMFFTQNVVAGVK